MLPDSLDNIAFLIGLSSKNEISSWESITPGRSSCLWKVTTNRGIFVLKQPLKKLRVNDKWHISPHRSKNEYNYLKELSDVDFEHTPRVLNYKSQKNYFIMKHIDSSYPNWKAKLLSEDIDPMDSFKAGDVLGKLHTFFLKRPCLFSMFNDKDLFHQARISPYWIHLLPKYPELKKNIRQIINTSLKKKITVIHGDVSPKNFLILKDKAILLDAECAFWGDPAYDLAFLLTHLILKSCIVPNYSSCLISVISESLRAYCPYISWESHQEFLERVQSYLLMLILARIDGKASLDYIDSNQKKLIRSFVKSKVLNDKKMADETCGSILLHELLERAFSFLKDWAITNGYIYLFLICFLYTI